jgi:hypothetical protein
VSFEVDFAKPEGQLDNRPLVAAFLRTFPDFQEVEIDQAAAAQDLAADAGVTPSEWVERGIGIQCLSFTSDDWWVEVSFWNATVMLRLPNFPPAGIDAALEATACIRAFLRNQGLASIDPLNGQPRFGVDEGPLLRAAYADRQRQIVRVGALVGVEGDGQGHKCE